MKSRTLRLKLALIAALSINGCVSTEEEAVGVAGGPSQTFQEWKASLPVTDDGAYVVEGDIPVYDEAELTDYYAATFLDTALLLDIENGVDNKYTVADALTLQYCVSTAFGVQNHAIVRDTFAAAANEWMEATKIATGDAPTIRFTYVQGADNNCTNANPAGRYAFNIVPENTTDYDALSFRPHRARAQRTLKIAPQAFTPHNQQTFAGVLRHEIGHILGFRHEHIAAINCAEEDATWRALTPYDIPSVMHYRAAGTPSCAGSTGLTDYTLTTHDNAGVRCIYTTQARAGADTAGDACRALTSLSTSAPAFTIGSNGNVYRLTQATAANGVVTSTIARYVAPTSTASQTWQNLWSAAEPGGATTGIFAGGAELYRRTATRIYRWTGVQWAALEGDAGSSVVVAHSSGDLFRLNVASQGVAAGSIDRFVAGTVAASHILTGGAAGRKLFPGTSDLFRLDSNNALFQWTAAGWSAQAIGTGIKSAAKTESGRIFALLTDATGTVMERNSNNSWFSLTNVASGGASAIWGGLEVPYMSMINNPNTAADESKIIRRNPSGTTWLKYALSSTKIMKGGPRRIAINTNGRPYYYATP